VILILIIRDDDSVVGCPCLCSGGRIFIVGKDDGVGGGTAGGRRTSGLRPTRVQAAAVRNGEEENDIVVLLLLRARSTRIAILGAGLGAGSPARGTLRRHGRS
jgi:hypothetical protein